jgi:Ca2+-binding EF-hand superfamily protein
MNFTSSKLLTVAVASLLAASAFAGEEKAHDPMSGADAKDPIEAEMRLMDANKDGKIAASEHVAGAQEMFKAMDANQDNRVTSDEMDATQKPWKSQDASHHKGQVSSAEKIKVVDTNGDGVLTAQEHAAGSKSMFTKMDGDKDGYLTAAEVKSGHKQLMMSKDE